MTIHWWAQFQNGSAMFQHAIWATTTSLVHTQRVVDAVVASAPKVRTRHELYRKKYEKFNCYGTHKMKM